MGTKLDIVNQKDYKRQVTSDEAIAFARKLSLSGFIETSAKDSKTLGMAEDVDDCFLLCAYNCFHNSIEKK